MRKDYDLSVLIPARNEMFLARTIEDILKHRYCATEVIAVCDGCWPDPPVVDHPDVTLIYYPESIGQRAATNQAASLSKAKYIMKCDAHCSFDKGFDRKLIDDCEYDWTVIPRMYNFHVFDWKCADCGNRIYQGPEPEKCEKCGSQKKQEMVIVWKPRRKRLTMYWRFDENMHFQYWGAYKNRQESKGQIVDVMSSIGACWFMHRERYWDLGGLDENHGSWGQMGTEIACKSWLSGGRHVVNKRTWFAHMFRTQSGFKFPYPLSNDQVKKARQYSNDLWKNNKWPGQKHNIQWLIDKFDPPDWPKQETVIQKAPPIRQKTVVRGAVYYTDNACEERILRTCRRTILKHIPDWEIISVSQYPIDFGKNIVLPIGRNTQSMFTQIVKGLETSTADIVYLLEHDVLYHRSHFDGIPPDEKTFYYDRNRWCVDTDTGKAIHYLSDCPSFMCAYRELLLEHYSKVLDLIVKHGWTSKYGYSPPKGLPKEARVGRRQEYMADKPSIDIRHNNTFTAKRMTKDVFRNERSCKGWQESGVVEGWGATLERWDDFLTDVMNVCK